MKVPARWVALTLAAGLAACAFSGRSELLVRPWFTPVLVGTAVLIAVLAIRLRTTVRLTTALILLLPVAVGATLTPAVAGRVSQGAANTASLASRLGDPANPLLQGKGGDVTLLQILLAEQRSGGVVLAGIPVTVEAIAAGPHEIKRSVIVCCAADAQTISLTETGPALPKAGTWVRIEGKLGTNGDKTVLVASQISDIGTPADPFL